MALLRSSDVLPHGPDGLLVAAGALDGDPSPRNGVAALSSTELLVGTEPARSAESGRYGVDLIVVPRPRLTSLAVEYAAVTATVSAGERSVAVPIAVAPSLAAAIRSTLVPALAAS
jgi:hypothetical protein